MRRQFHLLPHLGPAVLSTLSFIFLGASTVAAQTSSLQVVGFNVESGDASPTTLVNQISPIDGVDLWGFSEVDSASWADMFETAAEAGEDGDPNFETILGSTGGRDRLAIIYNADRFELRETQELNDINPGGRVRSPLVVRLYDQETEQEFWFMVNHLYRSRAEARHQQATQLNAWAQEQTLPIVAVGDYNFDWDIPSNGVDRDQGFDNLIAGDVFEWIEPTNILKTHCSRRFNSILDFVFLANQPETWQATSEILFPEDSYCPDDRLQSDHRPVAASIQFGPDDDDLKEQLLQRIEQIEQELEEMRQLINEKL